MPVKVLGLGLQALYDTGAVGSVISTKVWKSIPAERRPALEPCRRRLITVSNHPVDTEGEVTLRMELDGRLVSHLMVVADVIDDLVLGLDLLAPLKLTWDWEIGAVRWPERTEEVSRENFGAVEVIPPEGNIAARREEDAQEEEITKPDSRCWQDMEVLPYIPRGLEDKRQYRDRVPGPVAELVSDRGGVVEAMCHRGAVPTDGLEPRGAPKGEEVPETGTDQGLNNGMANQTQQLLGEEEDPGRGDTPNVEEESSLLGVGGGTLNLEQPEAGWEKEENTGTARKAEQKPPMPSTSRRTRGGRLIRPPERYGWG